MTKNQHVVPHEGGWAVRSEGSSGVTSVRRTQQQAVDQARRTAGELGGELFVHGRDGRIRRRDTTGGNDPSPPRG